MRQGQIFSENLRADFVSKSEASGGDILKHGKGAR